MGLFIANYTKEDFMGYLEECHWNTQGEKEFFSSFYDFVEKLEDDPLDFEDFFVNFSSYDGMDPDGRKRIIQEIDAVFKDERYAVPQELKDSFQKNVVSRDIEKELAEIKAKEEADKLDEIMDDEAEEEDEYYLADPEAVDEVVKGIIEQKPKNAKDEKEFETLQVKKELGLLYGEEEDRGIQPGNPEGVPRPVRGWFRCRRRPRKAGADRGSLRILYSCSSILSCNFNLAR